MIENPKNTEQIEKKNKKEKNTINLIIFIGGFISLIFGIIGIVIPILPTTPFLLLASAAFAKSSQKFHRWLLNNKILGFYIRNYKEGKGMPIKIKIITLALLWLTIMISFFLIRLFWVQILLICIAFAVSIHIILIRPKKNIMT
ncbi:MAG: YbaN family protein [Promethearchaeota archaeon]